MNVRPILFAILCAFSSAFAGAQEQPPGGMPPGMPGGSKIMFKQGGLGTMGSMSVDLPSVGIAYLPMDHMQVGLSLGVTYDSGGVPADPAQSPFNPVRLGSPGEWRSALLVAVEYMLHDQFPFAMGPQFAVMATLAPGSAFDNMLLNPAWGFWYAPFNAPIGIGSSLGFNIALYKDMTGARKVNVSLATPAVRLVYVFN